MDVRNQILAVVREKYGRAEEELMASGIIDSLRAVELAMALEEEFDLPADSFTLRDMMTVTSLSERILAARKG